MLKCKIFVNILIATSISVYFANGLILSRRITSIDKLFEDTIGKWFPFLKQPQGESHDCYRECKVGDYRTCVYNFSVGMFTTMSSYCGDCPYNQTACYNPGCITAGGKIRMVSATNEMVPGPSIFVCENDTIVVNVHNNYDYDAITIHWHGIHQIGTPWSDGVPFVSQCPILPHQIFQYKFSAYPAGTLIWHGHTGLHEADGLFGQLVVRKPDDSNNALYDFDLAEHSMIIWHWMNRTTAEFLLEFDYNAYPQRGYDVLVNGFSAKNIFTRDGVNYTTPRAIFNVKQGMRYRFRAAFNALLYCPMQLSIDNHTLTMIASDTGEFQAVNVSSFIGGAGERFDWVLHANQPVGTYWIRITTHGVQCNDESEGLHVHQEAILKYEGSTEDEPQASTDYMLGLLKPGVLLNPVEQAWNNYSQNQLIKVVDLNSTIPTPDVSGRPDKTIYLEFRLNGYMEMNLIVYYPQINNLTFQPPPSNMLTQPEETSPIVCNSRTKRYNCQDNGLCNCPYVEQMNLNSLVEVVLINTDYDFAASEDHSIHLHGYHFQVVAMETIGPNITTPLVRSMNEAGKIKKNLRNRTLKDTVGLPNQGFAIFRFRASNPGYWFIHCHFSDHNTEGMALVFKVGRDHINIPQPKPPFPQCQDYPIHSSHSPFQFMK